jgi:predicted N-acetyltransferase YhbS
MNINMWQEESSDYPAVFLIIEDAFRNMKISNHQEQLFDERLRKSKAFISVLSLIALLDNKIVGISCSRKSI